MLFHKIRIKYGWKYEYCRLSYKAAYWAVSPGCQNVPTYEIQICEQGRCFTWEGNSELIKRYFSFPLSFPFAEYLSLFGQDHVSTQHNVCDTQIRLYFVIIRRKEVFICTAVQIILWLFVQVHCPAAFMLSSRLPLFVYTLQLTVLYLAGAHAHFSGR